MFAIGLIGLALSACAPDPTCRELGCDPGEVCDRSSGACIQRSTDCTETGCSAGLQCNPSTGECRPETPPCPETPCPSGYVCDTRQGENQGDGVCTPRNNCTMGDCPSPAETCDTQSGRCVAKTCSSHSDCPPTGFICGDNGRCVSGCLLNRDNCPTGSRCRPPPQSRSDPSSNVGACRQRCQSNRDCPYGQECASNPSICTPEGPCDDDDECRSDEVCRNNSCGAPPCSSDDACPGDQICDQATGICLGGDCTEDNLAPNHTPSDAADVQFDTITGLRLCPGRSDWFSVDVDSGQAVRVRIEHDVTRDVDFTVHGEDGRILDFEEQAPPPNVQSGRFVASTTFISPRAQTVRLRVYSQRRHREEPDATPLPESADYDLRIRPSRETSCSDDAYEENDARATAAQLPSNTGAEPKFQLQICGGDTDWFALPNISARAQLQARLTDVAEDDDHLRFELISEEGTHVSLTPSQAQRLLRTGPEQTWYMKISSRSGTTAPYAIRYRIDGSYQCPQADSHSTVPNALALPPRTETTYHLCPLEKEWEVDWLDLTAPPSRSPLKLDVQPVQPEAVPRLDVSLYENQKSGVKLLRSASRTGGAYELEADINPSQDLLLRVGPPPMTGRPGILEGEPKYRVRYEYGSP